jgi:hypothetical protein
LVPADNSIDLDLEFHDNRRVRIPLPLGSSYIPAQSKSMVGGDYVNCNAESQRRFCPLRVLILRPVYVSVDAIDHRAGGAAESDRRRNRK